MRKFTFALFLLPALAFADVVPVPDSDFWGALLTFLGGVKGLSVLAVVAGAVQLAMIFFKTQLSSFTGIYKLLFVTGLTWLGVVLGNLVTGMPPLQALVTGPSLAALQVFLHQLYTQFIEKKAV